MQIGFLIISSGEVLTFSRGQFPTFPALGWFMCSATTSKTVFARLGFHSGYVVVSIAYFVKNQGEIYLERPHTIKKEENLKKKKKLKKKRKLATNWTYYCLVACVREARWPNGYCARLIMFLSKSETTKCGSRSPSKADGHIMHALGCMRDMGS